MRGRDCRICCVDDFKNSLCEDLFCEEYSGEGNAEDFLGHVYAKGYNNAKREIALSGEYERVYQRGKSDAYTIEELKNVFLHGISLPLCSKKSAQHWSHSEETAEKIRFLEQLYEKVKANRDEVIDA